MTISGLHLTATKQEPPKVEPFGLVPESSPTVWYGGELDPQVGNHTASSLVQHVTVLPTIKDNYVT